MLSLGSSSVMSSQDCRSNKETQQCSKNILAPGTAVTQYVRCMYVLILLSHIIKVSGLQVLIL